MRLRALVLGGLLSAAAFAADPIVPVTVCEVIGNLALHEGKDLAILGRYSFRKEGRWLGEQSCGEPASTGGVAPTLWLTEDAANAPKPPGNFELDATALNHKFVDILKHTVLGKFRFGTSDYDRWAVVYGRVVARKGEDAKKAPADLVFRGSGVVIFLTTEH